MTKNLPVRHLNVLGKVERNLRRMSALGRAWALCRANSESRLSAILILPDQQLLATATETARKLAMKVPAALQACKRLMGRSTREQLERAVKLENEEFAARVRSAEAKEACTALLEKRPPNFTRANENEKPKARVA
jgi:enoyl-CoA hydratase/carnithine racemase